MHIWGRLARKRTIINVGGVFGHEYGIHNTVPVLYNPRNIIIKIVTFKGSSIPEMVSVVSSTWLDYCSSRICDVWIEPGIEIVQLNHKPKLSECESWAAWRDSHYWVRKKPTGLVWKAFQEWLRQENPEIADVFDTRDTNEAWSALSTYVEFKKELDACE